MNTEELIQAVAEAELMSKTDMPTKKLKHRRELALACKGDAVDHPYYQCAIAFKSSGKTLEDFMDATGLPKREAEFLYGAISECEKDIAKLERLENAILEAENAVQEELDKGETGTKRNIAVHSEALSETESHPYYPYVKELREMGLGLEDIESLFQEQTSAVAHIFKQGGQPNRQGKTFTSYPKFKSQTLEEQVDFAKSVISGDLVNADEKRQYCIAQAVATKGRKYFMHHPYARIFKYLSSQISCADIRKYFPDMPFEDFVYFVTQTDGPHDFEILGEQNIPVVDFDETLDFPGASELGQEVQDVVDEVDREIIQPATEDTVSLQEDPERDDQQAVGELKPEVSGADAITAEEQGKVSEAVEETDGTSDEQSTIPDYGSLSQAVQKAFEERLTKILKGNPAKTLFCKDEGLQRLFVWECGKLWQLAQVFEYYRSQSKHTEPADHPYNKIMGSFVEAGYTPNEVAWLFPIPLEILQHFFGPSGLSTAGQINRFPKPVISKKVHTLLWGTALAVAGLSAAIGVLVGAYCY